MLSTIRLFKALPVEEKTSAETNAERYAELMKKTLPKGFPADFANPEILKLKHYFVSLDLNENEITDPNFTNHLAWLARVAYPLNQFLNYAVDESKD